MATYGTRNRVGIHRIPLMRARKTFALFIVLIESWFQETNHQAPEACSSAHLDVEAKELEAP